jgi:hemerythrin-like domain-containing protein
VDTSGEPIGRLAALGTELIDIHLRLRDELTRLREDVAAHLDGGGRRPRWLSEHCLAFCSMLSRHHDGEEGGVFPVLAERFPRLRPVIDELRRDHRLVTEVLRRVEELVGGLDPGRVDAGRDVRAELDGLAALLESHFGYEERRLVQALDSLGAGAGSAEDLLGLPGTDD